MENHSDKPKENPSLVMRLQLDVKTDRWRLWLDSDDMDAPPAELIAETRDLEYMWGVAQDVLKHLEDLTRARQQSHDLLSSLARAVAGAVPHKES